MQRRVAVGVRSVDVALETFGLDELSGKGNGFELSRRVVHLDRPFDVVSVSQRRPFRLDDDGQFSLAAAERTGSEDKVTSRV